MRLVAAGAEYRRDGTLWIMYHPILSTKARLRAAIKSPGKRVRKSMR
jgi:hypothetical protein